MNSIQLRSFIEVFFSSCPLIFSVYFSCILTFYFFYISSKSSWWFLLFNVLLFLVSTSKKYLTLENSLLVTEFCFLHLLLLILFSNLLYHFSLRSRQYINLWSEPFVFRIDFPLMIHIYSVALSCSQLIMLETVQAFRKIYRGMTLIQRLIINYSLRWGI